MALSNTAQPKNTSLRKLAVVVATAVAGMSAYAHAAEAPKKEETITVTAAPAAQESAWGPAPTIAAKRTATATKTDTPIEKTPQSISVVTREEMDMKQPGTVKQSLAYTPSVFATRGASTTYDVVSIRGFTTSSTVNTNQYLDGMKLQGETILKRLWIRISLSASSCCVAQRPFCTVKATRAAWSAWSASAQPPSH